MALRAQVGLCSSSRNKHQLLSFAHSASVRCHGATKTSRQAAVQVRAFFSWLTGNKPAGSKGSSEVAQILQRARTMKRGCELAPKEAPEGLKLATFAGGCFWSVELKFQRTPGVVSTFVGYAGGKAPNPTYEEVCSGSTGHTEIVQVTYDPKQVTYEQLMDVFFDHVDPTMLNRQGNDRGTQYRSAIMYHDDEQKRAAEQRIALVGQQLAEGRIGQKWASKKVWTTVEPAGDVYIAEAYHQQYLAKGGRFGMGQSAAKGCTDPIRCYG